MKTAPRFVVLLLVSLLFHMAGTRQADGQTLSDRSACGSRFVLPDWAIVEERADPLGGMIVVADLLESSGRAGLTWEHAEEAPTSLQKRSYISPIFERLIADPRKRDLRVKVVPLKIRSVEWAGHSVQQIEARVDIGEKSTRAVLHRWYCDSSKRVFRLYCVTGNDDLRKFYLQEQAKRLNCHVESVGPRAFEEIEVNFPRGWIEVRRTAYQRLYSGDRGRKKVILGRLPVRASGRLADHLPDALDRFLAEKGDGYVPDEDWETFVHPDIGRDVIRSTGLILRGGKPWQRYQATMWPMPSVDRVYVLILFQKKEEEEVEFPDPLSAYKVKLPETVERADGAVSKEHGKLEPTVTRKDPEETGESEEEEETVSFPDREKPSSWTSAQFRHLFEAGNESFREWGARILRNPRALPEEKARKLLTEVLRNDKSNHVRRTAADSIGARRDEKALDSLVKAVKLDEALDVKAHAITAIGNTATTRSEKLTQLLVETLETNPTDEFKFRARILDALGKVGRPAAIPAMIQAMNKPDPSVARYGPGAIRRLLAESDVRSQNAYLPQLLNHENHLVRQGTVKYLEKYGEAGHLETLETIMAEGTEDGKAAARKAYQDIQSALDPVTRVTHFVGQYFIYLIGALVLLLVALLFSRRKVRHEAEEEAELSEEGLTTDDLWDL